MFRKEILPFVCAGLATSVAAAQTSGETSGTVESQKPRVFRTENDEPINREADLANEFAEEIVVTGSRIKRDFSSLSANTILITEEDLKATGEATLEAALRKLPQSIDGASGVGNTLDGANLVNGSRNIFGASTINLRGLGAESTLILVDGRRIGKTGITGGPSNIAGIPLSAIERVEILLDGASAVYGSDAVGGVVNVVLKKDASDAAVELRYGVPEARGFEEYLVNLNVGKAWESGNVRFTYEHRENTHLDASERPYAVGDIRLSQDNLSLVRAMGNRPIVTSVLAGQGVPLLWEWNGVLYPGNMPPPDPAATPIASAYVPLNPADPDNLTHADFSLEDTILVENPDFDRGKSLLPASQGDSLTATFRQDLWRSVSLGGTLLYRNLESQPSGGEAIISTFSGHPQFGQNPFSLGLDPNLTAPMYINGLLPGVVQNFDAETDNIHIGLDLSGDIGESWGWQVQTSHSYEKNEALSYNGTNRNGLFARSFAPFGPPPADTSGYFNPFCSPMGSCSSDEVLNDVVHDVADTGSRNRETTADLIVDGSLFATGAGDVKAAFAGGWREEELDSWNRIDGPGSPQGSAEQTPVIGTWDNSVSRSNDWISTEFYIPLVGDANAVTGFRRLSVDLSARHDDYDNSGSDSTWSAGISWKPIDQLGIRYRESTAFLAPTLSQGLIDRFERPGFVSVSYPGEETCLNHPQFGLICFPRTEMGSTYISGGNPDLGAERSRSKSAALDFTPNWAEGLSMTVAWHNTDYTDRIAPFPISPFNIIAGVDDIAYPDRIYQDPNATYNSPFAPWVVDTRWINLAYVEQSGVDYRVNYSASTEHGEFSFGLNVARLLKYRESLDGTKEVSLVGSYVGDRLAQALPKHRAIAAFSWAHRGFDVSVNGTYSSEVETMLVNLNPFLPEPIVTDHYFVQAPTLVDLVLGYSFEDGDLWNAPNWLDGTRVALTVTNLGDDTVKTRSLRRNGRDVDGEWAGFNSSASDPRGRMYSISLRKQF